MRMASLIRLEVGRLEPLLTSGKIDCLIAESEDGFCQLGQERRLLSDELGYVDTSLAKYTIAGYSEKLEPSIGQLCDWNRSENKDVTLIVMPARRAESRLKGLILSPYDDSKCYQKFANGSWARPHRDFVYNVTYEALEQAFHYLGARRIAVTHLSRVKTFPGGFKEDVTKCQVEAALHFCREHEEVEAVVFWDPTPGNPVQGAVDYFLALPDVGRNRPIRRFSTEQWGIKFVNISWSTAAPLAGEEF